jgi:gluconate kinase
MSVEKVLLLSGAMGAGKTSVATAVRTMFQFEKISSSGYLLTLIDQNDLKDASGQRVQLQELGDQLDEETDFRWVVDEVAEKAVRAHPEIQHWLVDAVRKRRQVDHFRNCYGRAVRHVHLSAPDDVLRARYVARHDHGDDHYNAAVLHPNEVNSRGLSEIADQIFDTTNSRPEDIAANVFRMWETDRV